MEATGSEKRNISDSYHEISYSLVSVKKKETETLSVSRLIILHLHGVILAK